MIYNDYIIKKYKIIYKYTKYDDIYSYPFYVNFINLYLNTSYS